MSINIGTMLIDIVQKSICKSPMSDCFCCMSIDIVPLLIYKEFQSCKQVIYLLDSEYKQVQKQSLFTSDLEV